MRRAVPAVCLLLLIPAATSTAAPISKLLKQQERAIEVHEDAQTEAADLRSALALQTKRVRAHRRAADQAVKVAEHTGRDAKRAAQRSVRAEQKLTDETINYQQTVATLQTGTSSTSPTTEDLMHLASSATESAETAMVYVQGSVLVEEIDRSVDSLQAASDEATQRDQEAGELHRAAEDAAAESQRQMRASDRAKRALRSAQRQALIDEKVARRKLRQIESEISSGDWDPVPINEDLENLSVQDRIVVLAQSEFKRAVVEVPNGSNKSSDILRYLTATEGSVAGAAWCAYFTSYITARSGRPVGTGGRGLGYVPDVRAWGVKHSRYFPEGSSTQPQPGDLVTWPQHIGIVVKVNDDNTIETVEGNSSNRVANNTRDRGSITGYVRTWGKPLRVRTTSTSGGSTPDGTL